jgi:hypothetical protein
MKKIIFPNVSNQIEGEYKSDYLFQLAGAAALNLWKSEKLIGRTDLSSDEQYEISREVTLAKTQLNHACEHLSQLGLGSGHFDV